MRGLTARANKTLLRVICSVISLGIFRANFTCQPVSSGLCYWTMLSMSEHAIQSQVNYNIESNVCNDVVGLTNYVAWLSQVFKRSIPMTFLIGSPASGWTRNFRLEYIELP